MLKDAECFTYIYLRTGRTDMRLGIDGLLAVIGWQMELDPTEPGSIFLFCGHKKDRIKALIFEGDGWLLCYKRLTGDCSYQWPRDESEAGKLTKQQFRWLMEQLKEYPRNDVPEEELKKLMPWLETPPDCCKQLKKQS